MLQRTSRSRPDIAEPSSSGPIAIVKASISGVRSELQPSRATLASKSRGHSSATSSERMCDQTVRRGTSTDCHRHILNAAKNLRELDQKQVDAVSARIDLDLRTGYAFTRFLTNSLRSMGGPLQQATISYGTPMAATKETCRVAIADCPRLLSVSHSGLRRRSLLQSAELRPRRFLEHQGDAQEGRSKCDIQLGPKSSV